MALVELRNVSKIYRLGEEEIRALDDVTLDIDEGEFISIIGPSGSGKSTLMHILGCLDSPSKGTIQLDGVIIHNASSRQLASIRNRCASGSDAAAAGPSGSWRLERYAEYSSTSPKITASDEVGIRDARKAPKMAPNVVAISRNMPIRTLE